jgi:SagB-type dehydrogenase family enzyme
MPIQLNPPSFKEENLQSLLIKRHSCRSFQPTALTKKHIAALLWATAGKKFDATSAATKTIPSAGARYPLELFLIVGSNAVDGVEAGIYHYLADSHCIELTQKGDIRKELAQACLNQGFIATAPVTLLIAADRQRTTSRYGERGIGYVYLEAGHACQNAYLAATALELGTVEVGAFSDKHIHALIGLEESLIPIVIMPVGYPQ